jgi:hypothetical protein
MPFANDCLDSGYSTMRDIPSVEADQCTIGTATLQLVDPHTGAPIDLTNYDITTSSSSSSEDFTGLKVVMKELPEDPRKFAEIYATAVDPVDGQVSFDYTAQTTRLGGVLTAEVQIWQTGSMRRVCPFFFIVNPDLESHEGAQLTIAEIRMTMRDVDPEGNALIDQLEFSRQEIALCMRRCIDYWNESLPPVGTYKPTNFPWRFRYSLGVTAQLYQMAAANKMRNDLPYSAGGVTVADTIKWQQYANLGDKLWADWIQWVKDTKYHINVMGAFHVLGGYRRYEGYYR